MSEDPFAEIFERGPASYNWADPSEEYCIAYVRIPKYDIDVDVSYDPPRIGIDDVSWLRAIDEILAVEHRTISDRRAKETLEEFLDEHHDDLWEEWKQHRATEIAEEIEELKEEREDLLDA